MFGNNKQIQEQRIQINEILGLFKNSLKQNEEEYKFLMDRINTLEIMIKDLALIQAQHKEIIQFIIKN